MNPVFLMATHNRLAVTSANLLRLRKLGGRIVLVVSEQMEKAHFLKQFPDLIVIVEANYPLGFKWQQGVHACKAIQADPIVIVGSDDFISKHFLDHVSQLLHENEFIGFTSWLTLDEDRNELFHCEYTGPNRDFPIGSGKVLSQRLLEKIEYQVFDYKLNCRLDDYSYHNAVAVKAKISIQRQAHVLAVKGQWNSMNTVEAYKKSPNISMLQIHQESLKNFDYVRHCWRG